ncbi:MAG TPA: tRNA isopentenyl-2-thiomethyl-A-37 hydroxylase MiaE [Woeseiaceae bacterium]|nr:tRNA isopentenyl-2-thiomethyl-A-37 hydroxylase MiaE [Woeseiaceae bacterium]
MALSGAVPAPVAAFLESGTAERWVIEACGRLPELLLDHANCELKAASAALALIYRYSERRALADRMSRLAREELRHFEQVRAMLDAFGVPFEKLTASRYASKLNAAVRASEPERLLDKLLVGALIEARSCERFAVLAPRLPQRLADFYRGLLASEARHFEHYLAFARSETGLDDAGFDERLAELKSLEADLVGTPDPDFRFHSGVPRSERPLEPAIAGDR